MLPSDFNSRPRSEVLNRGTHASGDSEKVNGWREDLQHYERNLEEMTSVNLDQNFKEELQHVDQWFRYLSETERTATIYTLLQHSSQVQVRFFISILQQLMKRDPLHSYLTPANPEQDMQSQLAGAVAKMELEAGQRGRTGATIRRPPSTGSERHVVDNRHSFALGDTEDYSRLFGPMGSNSNSMLNLNGSMMDDFGRAPISRASNRNSLFASAAATQRSRPRSVIEGDSSLLFPSGNTSTWLQPPHHNTSSTLGGRLGMAAERPKSADVSMWTLPSRDPIDDKKRSGWGVPSTVQFADLSPRDDWNRRAGRNIPGTVPETDERTNNSSATSSSSINPALDSANLVLSSSRSPVPSVSASAPFTRRHHHLAPPGMEKHYGQFLNPADMGGLGDDHDYLSDHSEASNLSTDRGYKRRVASAGKSPVQSTANRTSKDSGSKKTAETVNMDLLEDVPAWFRSLRLHKYNAIFEPMKWQDIIKMTDDDLQAKGVAALGARRKMLKVFETIRAHCDANNIEY